VLAFTLAVFVVYLAGGLAIVLGLGQLALAAIPHPSPQARHIIEIAIGSVMLGAAALLWLRRRRLSDRRWSTASTRLRSSAILGATLTIVELPTAFHTSRRSRRSSTPAWPPPAKSFSWGCSTSASCCR
jgi:hypothetical protein